MSVRPVAALSAFSALALLSLASHPASADLASSATKPTSLSIGDFFPSSSVAKNNGGDNQFALGLRYSIGGEGLLTKSSLGVDWEHGGSSNDIVGLTVGQQFGLTGAGPDAANSAYAGVGIGDYILVKDAGFGSHTNNDIGGFVDVGYNFTSFLFVDAKYQIVNDGDGPILSAGVRF